MLSIVVPFHTGKRGVSTPRRAAGDARARDARGRARRRASSPAGRCSSPTTRRRRTLAAELGAAVVDDPGGGQGAAVAAALEELEDGPVLVVNADVPCVVPHDLRTLAGTAELGAVGVVEADDGTTNALALPRPELFAPLYGPGSAARFRGARGGAGGDGDRGGDPEPRRRRRHARRPAAGRSTRGAADAGRARPRRQP